MADIADLSVYQHGNSGIMVRKQQHISGEVWCITAMKVVEDIGIATDAPAHSVCHLLSVIFVEYGGRM